MRSANSKIATYRALHQSGCFVQPNPWDVGSALWLERAGFPALATSSAGMAFTYGLPNEVWAVPVELMLERIRALATAATVPMHADFQSGYARDAEGVAKNVRACIDTGVAWGAFARAARELYEKGTFDGFAGAATFAELNQLFSQRGGKR